MRYFVRHPLCYLIGSVVRICLGNPHRHPSVAVFARIPSVAAAVIGIVMFAPPFF
ncbi:hypothetical protein K3T49_17580 [Paenibacillus sonchi]|nr:hypothetical protein [Paenibacillus sonchi]